MCEGRAQPHSDSNIRGIKPLCALVRSVESRVFPHHSSLFFETGSLTGGHGVSLAACSGSPRDPSKGIAGKRLAFFFFLNTLMLETRFRFSGLHDKPALYQPRHLPNPAKGKLLPSPSTRDFNSFVFSVY